MARPRPAPARRVRRRPPHGERARIRVPMIRLKRVYEPREAEDGLRVLVMRRWPRGIRKERIDLWLKELGADLQLLSDWKAGRVTWPERRRRYLDGLQVPGAVA